MGGLDRRSFLAGLCATVIGSGAQGNPGRIEIRQGRRHVIEGGREHRFADTIFEVPPGYSGEAIGLEIGPGARVDVLRIRLAPGARNIDRFLQIGPGVRIGLLDVEAAEQTDHHDHRLDGFVQISADDIRIERMRFHRIDRCVTVQQAARLWIGSFECASYSKGFRIYGSEDVYIGRFHAHTASPHAVLRPGENGLTVSDSRRLRFPEIVVEDAAEHAIYLAGGGKLHSSDIRFGRVVSRRAGACGFKCKSPKNPSVGVSIDRLEVADSAARALPDSKVAALRVENCRDFQVGSLETFRETRGHSCNIGLYLNGTPGFSLHGGHIDSPRASMVMFEDRRRVDNAGITIAGLDGTRVGAHGYHVHHTRGQALSGLEVDGGVLDGVAGDLVRIEGKVRIVPGTNHIRIAARNVGGALVRGAEDADVLDVQVSPGG